MILEIKDKIIHRGLSRLDDYLEDKDYNLSVDFYNKDKSYFKYCNVAEYSTYEENKRTRFELIISEEENKIKIKNVYLKDTEYNKLKEINDLNIFLSNNYENIINYLSGNKAFDNVLMEQLELYHITNDHIPEILKDFIEDDILRIHRKEIKKETFVNKIINRIKV